MKLIVGVALTAALLCAAGTVGAAEDASGNWINTSTPNAPGYRDLEAPSGYELPPVTLPEPRDEPAELSSQQTVLVREVALEGVSALTQGEIEAIVDPFLGRRVTLGELQSIRFDLSQIYYNKGYVNSGVLIPDQTVSDGVVRMEAVEGRLTDIEVVGDPHLDERYIRNRLDRYIDDPLNLADVQDAIQRIRLDPHIERVNAELKPGARPGASVLRLGVRETPRFFVGVSGDNHRSSSLGEWNGRWSGVISNLSGWGERVEFGITAAEGADDHYASAEIPINSMDTRIRVHYARSHSEIVEDSFKALDIESVTDTWGIALSHPIFSNINNVLAVNVGFDKKHSETKLLGLPFSLSPGAIDGRSTTSTAWAALNYTGRGEQHALVARLSFRKGINDFGATEFVPRSSLDYLFNPTGADGDFEMWQAQALFVYRLNAIKGLSVFPDRAQLLTRFTLQKSMDALMSLEKLAIGGSGSVRGYAENLLVRDNGLALSAELQIPVPGYHSEPGWLNLIVRPFVDFGRSWDEVDADPFNPERDTSNQRYVMSMGLGVDWRPVRNVRVVAEYGKDVGDNFRNDDPRDFDTEDEWQDKGFHVSVSYGVQF